MTLAVCRLLWSIRIQFCK